MAKQRAQRVGEEIKKEVSEILHLQLNDPGLTKMTSVTGVEVTRDLSYATIYVTFFDERGVPTERVEALEKATGFIRSSLSKKLKTYKTPELRFVYDESLNKGQKVDEILRSLKDKEEI